MSFICDYSEPRVPLSFVRNDNVLMSYSSQCIAYTTSPPCINFFFKLEKKTIIELKQQIS